jgi:hypothetical protein
MYVSISLELPSYIPSGEVIAAGKIIQTTTSHPDVVWEVVSGQTTLIQEELGYPSYISTPLFYDSARAPIKMFGIITKA